MKSDIGVRRMLRLAICALCSTSLLAFAQQGYNAVYTASGGVANLAASSAWIDASAFCGSSGSNACGVSGSDVCTMISDALGNIPSGAAGAVIDARGVLPPSTSAQQCSGNPFAGFTTNIPITILLPASTIYMTPASGSTVGTWVLPNNTRLIGAGVQTLLYDPGNCCSGPPGTPGSMIQMGPLPASGLCPASGISVEHLRLGGTVGSNNYYGIDNECATSSSYVNDVGMANIPGIGLEVGPSATNSGPYTNLSDSLDYNSCSGTSLPSSCVDLEAQTQGLHGITCVGDSENYAATRAGIIVNAGNNSIDDVHVESYWDGIEIGNTSMRPVRNVTVSNVFVSTTNDCTSFGGGPVVNAVHICGSSGSNVPFGECGVTGGTVSDITILGASNGSGQTAPLSVTSIQDDVTGTSIAGCWASGVSCPPNNYTVDPITSGLYILGEPTGGPTGYTRFATSPANPNLYGSSTTVVPTWGVGTASPSGSACNAPGALYSNTATTTGDSVYVCTFASGSGFVWTAFP